MQCSMLPCNHVKPAQGWNGSPSPESCFSPCCHQWHDDLCLAVDKNATAQKATHLLHGYRQKGLIKKCQPSANCNSLDHGTFLCLRLTSNFWCAPSALRQNMTSSVSQSIVHKESSRRIATHQEGLHWLHEF